MINVYELKTSKIIQKGYKDSRKCEEKRIRRRKNEDLYKTIFLLWPIIAALLCYLTHKNATLGRTNEFNDILLTIVFYLFTFYGIDLGIYIFRKSIYAFDKVTHPDKYSMEEAYKRKVQLQASQKKLWKNLNAELADYIKSNKNEYKPLLEMLSDRPESLIYKDLADIILCSDYYGYAEEALKIYDVEDKTWIKAYDYYRKNYSKEDRSSWTYKEDPVYAILKRHKFIQPED